MSTFAEDMRRDVNLLLALDHGIPEITAADTYCPAHDRYVCRKCLGPVLDFGEPDCG